MHFHIPFYELDEWANKSSGGERGSDKSFYAGAELCRTLYIAIWMFVHSTCGGYFCKNLHREVIWGILNPSFITSLPAENAFNNTSVEAPDRNGSTLLGCLGSISYRSIQYTINRSLDKRKTFMSKRSNARAGTCPYDSGDGTRSLSVSFKPIIVRNGSSCASSTACSFAVWNKESLVRHELHFGSCPIGARALFNIVDLFMC